MTTAFITEAWEAEAWTNHAAVTVTTPDKQAITGKRVVAECSTPEVAALIAQLPALHLAVHYCANRLNHHRWQHPSDECVGLSVAQALREAIEQSTKP